MAEQILRFRSHGAGQEISIRAARTEPAYPWAYQILVRTTDGQCLGMTKDGYVYRVDYPDAYYLGDHGRLV